MSAILFSQEINSAFNKVAAHYQKIAVLSNTVADHMIARLEFIRIQPEIILDVGSATGYTARGIEGRYKKASIVLIDLAENMLKQAKKQARWFSQQHFIRANAYTLPFVDESVDMVVSNLMLHWCLDVPALLSEWHRVLKPEGLLMFTSYGPETLKELRAAWGEVDESPHVNYFMDMPDLGSALLQMGFVDPVLDMEYFQLTYPDVKHALREIKALGSVNTCAEKRKGLTGQDKLNKMVAAYEQYRDSDNKIPVSYEVIYGHAWKPSAKKASIKTRSNEVAVPINTIHKASLRD